MRCFNLESMGKTDNENLWGEFFISFINREKGLDYDIHSNKEESSDIDVFAKSKSGKYPDVPLQLTYAKEQDFSIINKPRECIYSKEVIIDAVERKIIKCSNDIILVIQGYMSECWIRDVFNQDLFNEIKEKEYNLRGIYYITPPSLINKNGKNIQSEGFCICLKDGFNKKYQRLKL